MAVGFGVALQLANGILAFFSDFHKRGVVNMAG
jgi:hypothetical protein